MRAALLLRAALCWKPLGKLLPPPCSYLRDVHPGSDVGGSQRSQPCRQPWGTGTGAAAAVPRGGAGRLGTLLQGFHRGSFSSVSLALLVPLVGMKV